MLYLSLIIFIFNVLAFMFYQDMQSLFLFVVVLCMTYLFDQNMIVVLLTPSLLVGLLIVMRKSFMNSSFSEGFTEGHDDPNASSNTNENSNENEDESGEGENNENENEDGDDEETEDVSKQGVITSSSTSDNSSSNSTTNSSSNSGSSSTSSSGTSNAQESYANLKNSSIKSELSNLVSNYEKAQKGMTKTLEKSKLDPQSLETQREIINQMNQITPVIKDSVKILNKVDMNGLNNLLGSLGNVIGNSPLPKPMSASTKCKDIDNILYI